MDTQYIDDPDITNTKTTTQHSGS